MNEDEKKVVSKMIAMYCRSKHGSKKGLCDECDALNRYAVQRLERCPFGDEKPTCASCPIHCYKSDMRLRIKEVMRTAGPQMLLLHPVDAVRHFYQERRRNRTFAVKSKVNLKK
jgi:Nitrous oxide-stimulated promoter.